MRTVLGDFVVGGRYRDRRFAGPRPRKKPRGRSPSRQAEPKKDPPKKDSEKNDGARPEAVQKSRRIRGGSVVRPGGTRPMSTT